MPRRRHPCDGRATPWLASPPPSSGHIPDGDQRIRAGTRHLRAVWTPGEVVEGGHRALHDPHTLPTRERVPPPSGSTPVQGGIGHCQANPSHLYVLSPYDNTCAGRRGIGGNELLP